MTIILLNEPIFTQLEQSVEISIIEIRWQQTNKQTTELNVFRNKLD